jgi:Ser/Thr protein kinase RdoA (MazF antagonist)
LIKEIERIFQNKEDRLIPKTAECYGLAPGELVNLGGFENFVFEVSNHRLIIRITHTIRRSKNYILGELEFIRYLAENKVPVAFPVRSKNGEWVERIHYGDGDFLITAFQQAPGSEPGEGDLTDTFFEKWGRLTGQIHALTKGFRPSHPTFKRQEWYEEDVLNFDKYIPAGQKLVHEMKQKLYSKLWDMPKNTDTYGLLHNDIHYGNIILNDGRLTLFDFDDCTYHWFVNDLAIAVHSILPGYDQEIHYGQIASRFLSKFMKGYRQQNDLGADWMGYIPDFLRLYDFVNYGIIHQTWDLNHLNSKQTEVIDRIRRRIEAETPLVEIDFGEI